MDTRCGHSRLGHTANGVQCCSQARSDGGRAHHWVIEGEVALWMQRVDEFYIVRKSSGAKNLEIPSHNPNSCLQQQLLTSVWLWRADFERFGTASVRTRPQASAGMENRQQWGHAALLSTSPSTGTKALPGGHTSSVSICVRARKTVCIVFASGTT
ncbi:hypothetical protein SKAU_G00241020 [Synaphobranchus kaupii]|uniref:Uncharacterized protein n=1 Tax=Synaphobranchus kaupii TaxID=118154 RepID=A0A9Q1F805_SYNKA|nr:hypothetical protein SKAU_G00241020 [Synaphobranchus kaupii]